MEKNIKKLEKLTNCKPLSLPELNGIVGGWTENRTPTTEGANGDTLVSCDNPPNGQSCPPDELICY